MPALVTFFSPIILGPEILIITRGQSGARGRLSGQESEFAAAVGSRNLLLSVSFHRAESS